jgi:hypothetical protein
MLPCLEAGDVLVVDHAPAEHPLGSVIVFLQGKTLVAHRVVGRTRRGFYVTKGDALVHLDSRRVPPAQIVGRVIGVERSGRPVTVNGSGRASRRLALFSRVVGEMYRLTWPIRAAARPFAGLLRRIPGPTRLLGALNAFGIRVARRRAAAVERDGEPR